MVKKRFIWKENLSKLKQSRLLQNAVYLGPYNPTCVCMKIQLTIGIKPNVVKTLITWGSKLKLRDWTGLVLNQRKPCTKGDIDVKCAKRDTV